jgi:formate--tetrahydrofolate ligase
VLEAATGTERPFQPIYRWDQPVRDKILAVAQTMYGAKDVVYTKTAEHDLRALEKNGYAGLPICVAKTQSSLSDDPGVRGRPTGFSITVRAIQVCAGAGFLVVMTGEIMRMPGLPKRPLAESLDLRDGEIIGLG